MSNCTLKREVLKCFKNLHRTRQVVFEGDKFALQQAQIKINEEFKKNKTIADVTKIKELIEYSNSVEHELKTTVIQAREVQPGIFEARIRPETVKLENVPFKDVPT